jgi:hypothetical protein
MKVVKTSDWITIQSGLIDDILEEDNLLPTWAQPHEESFQKLMLMQDELVDRLPDEDVERAMFGVSSMKENLDLSIYDINWNSERQGSYEEVQAEVDENPDYYDTRDVIIVDFMPDGSLELNDGHHRVVKAQEYDGVYDLPAEIQFGKGRAKEFLKRIKAPQQ